MRNRRTTSIINLSSRSRACRTRWRYFHPVLKCHKKMNTCRSATSASSRFQSRCARANLCPSVVRASARSKIGLQIEWQTNSARLATTNTTWEATAGQVATAVSTPIPGICEQDHYTCRRQLGIQVCRWKMHERRHHPRWHSLREELAEDAIVDCMAIRTLGTLRERETTSEGLRVRSVLQDLGEEVCK